MAKKETEKKGPTRKYVRKKDRNDSSIDRKELDASTTGETEENESSEEKTSSKIFRATKKNATNPEVKKVLVTEKLPTQSNPDLNTPTSSNSVKSKKLPAAFLKKQQQYLLDLRDNLVDQMAGVARDNLRGGGEDGSAFGMHQADAGSDSYDRDFALNLLSQEKDALYEIDEALKRIEAGTYGYCDDSGEAIPIARLEAMPFARRTVACQEKFDLQQKMGYHRQPVTSLFGLDEKDKTSVES